MFVIVSCVDISGCVFAGTPLTEDDCDALEKLLIDNNIELPPGLGQLSFKRLQRLLHDTGHRILAANLRTKLDTGNLQDVLKLRL